MTLETIVRSLTVFSLVLLVGLVPVHASQIHMTEGAVLRYKGARTSSGVGTPAYWEESIEILFSDPTSLVFQRELTSKKTQHAIRYENSFPIFVDYLPNLIYLPATCLAESLRGNLEWADNLQTQTSATVADKKSQKQDYAVEAGAFHCVNITFFLTGLEYGRLYLIYDLDSGLLVFEQWLPDYGDIIAYILVGTTLAKGFISIANLVLPSVALSIPVAILAYQVYHYLDSGRRKPLAQNRTPSLGRELTQKPFFAILASAILCLVSVFLPWSEFSNSRVYLLLGLPMTTGDYVFFPSSSILLMMSIAAHTAAALSWIGIALILQKKRRFLRELLVIASGALAFTSAFILIQTEWAAFWGFYTIVVSGVLAILGIIATNLRAFLVKKRSSGDTEELEPI